MSNPTSNFGWQMPTPTDLVTDLPADFEVFGQAVDTSMADLKGGTTGQILSKATNTDMDFVWITNDQGDITAVNVTSPITGGGTSGAVTVGIQSASTSQSGAVQLSDSTSTTSSVLASTPTATKAAYDLAAAAIPKSTVTAKGSIVAATASSTPAQIAVGNNGETLVADSSTATGLRYQAPKTQNAIYNSSMDIAQRGTSFTTVSGVAYTLDRWSSWASAVGSSIVTTQETGTATSRYSAKIRRSTGNTNTGNLSYFQSLETSDSLRFQGQTVNLSFYAKVGANYSGAGSTLGSNIATGTGTDQIYYNYTGVVNNHQSNTLTTSWQRFTHTVTLAANANEVSIIFYYTPVGTAGADDAFFVTGIQLEVGSVATPYNRQNGTIQGELAACQRYYWRVNTNATNTTTGLYGSAYSTTAAAPGRAAPVTMRVVPTSIDYSNQQLNDFAGTFAVTNVALWTGSSTDSLYVLATGATGLTTGRSYGLTASGTGYIGFSAEL